MKILYSSQSEKILELCGTEKELLKFVLALSDVRILFQHTVVESCVRFFFASEVDFLMATGLIES